MKQYIFSKYIMYNTVHHNVLHFNTVPYNTYEPYYCMHSIQHSNVCTIGIELYTRSYSKIGK